MELNEEELETIDNGIPKSPEEVKERTPVLTDEEVIERAVEFLKASSDHYKVMTDRKDRDMDMYSGTFWDTDTIKAWHRQKRSQEQWNCWRVFVHSISSPFSNSSWHTELESKKDRDEEDIQESINDFEADNDNKSCSINCLTNTAITGVGAMAFSIIDKSEEEQELKLENVEDISMVAFDPSITTTSGRDAEEGALINYISLRKAKRVYGEDIVGLNFPRIAPPICNCASQWPLRANAIQVVNYYYKESDGKVVLAQICGNKVVKHVVMPIDIIPIIRMTGYKIKTEDRKTDYIGVVRATYSLQLGANIGYSTLLERMNRNPKANFLMPVAAVTDLEKYYQIAGSDESALLLYNGSVAPTPIIESYQTQDLQQTINESMNLMSQVLGIPLTGINGIQFSDKTATEVLVQQSNSQSNVSCFYMSAYEAMKTVGKILIQLITRGKDLKFSLQNGPDVITRNAKKRQELSIIAGLLPENMKPIIAKYLADTLDDTYAKDIGDEIVANMDPSIKLIHHGEEDPNAVHVMKQMQDVLNKTMEELEASKAQNKDLQSQLDILNMQVLNNKQNYALDLQKHQDDVRLKEAELQLQGVKIDNAQVNEENKHQLDTEKVILDAQKSKMDILAKYR